MAAWQTVSWGEYGIFLVGGAICLLGGIIAGVISFFRK